jgi:hypothetical protein
VIDASGTTARPDFDLPVGVVYWRARSVLGGVAMPGTSPTWEFFVRARSAPLDASWGSILDLDGDGFGDLAAGSPSTIVPELSVGSSGNFVIFPGRLGGPNGTPAATIQAFEPEEGLGRGVGSAGDVNGDGYADLLVGAGSRKGAYVFFGGPTGLRRESRTAIRPSDTAEAFGDPVVGLGDANGDGYADFAVADRFYRGASAEAGRVYVYYGGHDGPKAMPNVVLEAQTNGEWFGHAMAGLDLNGDGFGDLVVGAPFADGEAGRFYVFMGGPSGLSVTPSSTFAAVGDVRAFAYSLAGAGDVDGDGYGDLVVGQGNDATRGRAFVYRGSATGLVQTPTILYSFDTIPTFGRIIAGAGDVNRDGFSDVLVSGSEKAYVLLFTGGATGIATTPTVRFDAPDPKQRSFGLGLAGLGDVDGDGVGDFAIGVSATSTTAGSIRLYRGARPNLGTTAAATLLAPTAADVGFDLAGGSGI